MKRYTLSFGQSIEHKPDHPERTAKRLAGWDVQYQVWTNRKAMAKTIRLQQEGGGPFNRLEWKPIVPLSAGEGY